MVKNENNEEYELEEMEIKYLFPLFFRFDNKHETTLLEIGTSILAGIQLMEFSRQVAKTLDELLRECYVEPPIKRRQKPPPFFEKFTIRDEKYVVDYTTTVEGRLMYTLFLRLDFSDKCIESGTEMILVKK